MAVLIPRTNAPQVQVGPAPNARNTASMDTGFLQRGIAELGDTAGRYFEQQVQIADDTALMDARNQLSAWEGSINDPSNPEGRNKYQGKNALDAGSNLLPKADAEISRIRQTLTPRQAADFDRVAGNFRAQFHDGLNRWADREFTGYEDATFKATNENLANDAMAAGVSGDWTRQASVANELLAINRRHLTSRGMGEEMIKASERGIVSNIHAGTLDGIMTADPLAGAAYYERWADQMLPDARAKAMRAIKPLTEDVRGDEDAAWAMSGDGRGAMNADAASVQAVYADIGAKHGFTTTSITRTAEENRRVNGVENSQHLEHRGTARDFSVRGKTPEQIEAFASDLRAQGFEVITKPHGTGPHVHVEMPTQKLPQGVPAANEAEALERARSIADPFRRQVAVRKVQEAYALRDMRNTEADRQVSEAVNLAVENADPNSGATLRQLLGSNYTRAAEKGWIPALESRWMARQGGKTEASDHRTVMAMDEAVYRASLGGEPARVALANFNPYDPTLNLSATDRRRYANAQLGLLSGDPKKVASVASDAEITQVIKQYVQGTLKKQPDSPEAQKFNTEMRLWLEAFENREGRKPGYKDVMQHADTLTMQGSFETPGLFFGTNTKEFRVTDLNIPPDVMITITTALRNAGADVNAENIATAYKNWQAGAR